MDVSRRNRLVEKLKVKQTQVGQNPGPTVSLEDFFEGNDDLGSIVVGDFKFGEADGVIGLDVLSSFRGVTIGFQNSVLILVDR
jgi:hypothetical protein